MRLLCGTKAPLVWTLFATLLLVSNAKITLDSEPAGWYTKYSHYPDYCSIEKMMTQHRIPLPVTDKRLGETRLVHVATVIRHGSRTPVKENAVCWDGYWSDDATGKWNCDLTTMMAPPTPEHAKEEEGMDRIEGSDAVALFEKHYDALKDPLKNILQGTCQFGQLLLQGYEQSYQNGQFLRSAYCYDGTSYDHDLRMRLLDLSGNDHKPWQQPHFYFRSDDDQRTLMSGQAVVRGMLEAEIENAETQGTHCTIPVHLADKGRDMVGWNEKACPRLEELRLKVEHSKIFRSFNQSAEAKELRKFMKHELKAPGEMDILECLMPTVCTDRPLPGALKYEDGWDLFDRLVNFHYKRENMKLLENDAEYSKLAMGPLWAEIMEKINPILNGDTQSPTRLALYSGHDSTIAPLLATLGLWNATSWPPYASMVNLEIHELIDGQSDKTLFTSKFCFRLIYNGQVITGNIPGCVSDLEFCDISVLTNRVGPFATRDQNCAAKSSLFTEIGKGGGGASVFVSMLILLVGALVGGLAVFIYLTGEVSKLGRKKVRLEDRRVDREGNIPLAPYSDNPGSGTTFSDEEPGKDADPVRFID